MHAVFSVHLLNIKSDDIYAINKLLNHTLRQCYELGMVQPDEEFMITYPGGYPSPLNNDEDNYPDIEIKAKP